MRGLCIVRNLRVFFYVLVLRDLHCEMYGLRGCSQLWEFIHYCIVESINEGKHLLRGRYPRYLIKLFVLLSLLLHSVFHYFSHLFFCHCWGPSNPSFTFECLYLSSCDWVITWEELSMGHEYMFTLRNLCGFHVIDTNWHVFFPFILILC